MRLLLDTSAYTALMVAQDSVVQQVREAQRIYLSAVVMGELLFGFRNGARFDQNRGQLSSFLNNPYIEFLPVTQSTADRFGRIATQLRGKGTPIPTNDIWIAAHALETGADLVTFDKHFDQVDGLVIATS